MLDAYDTLLELLPDVGASRVILGLGDQDLLSLNVTHLFGLQVDAVVGRTLVDHLDVGLLVAHDLVLDRRLVSRLRVVFDVAVDCRVLREDLAHKELFGESKRLYISLRHVHKLGLCVAAQVVVSKEGVGANLVSDMERLLLKWLLVSMVADSYGAVENEVHFEHLLFFVIDDIFFLLLAEVAGFEAESDVVQELAVLVLLGVEEEAEVVENVVKQVVHNDASLYLPGQCIDELVVFLHLAETVIGPEVLEVLVDLAVERVREGLVAEPGQQGHPVV